MPSATTTAKRAKADRACKLLVEMPGIRGVVLFGSVARGDADTSSDIDLIVLGSDAGMTSSQLRRRIAKDLHSDEVSVAYHTPASLQTYLERWSRFGAHLRLEGEILYDTNGEMAGILDTERGVDTDYEFASQARSLSRYAHANRFGGRFLFPLAHLYRIGRAAAFAAVAKSGQLEFDRRRTFALATEIYPELAGDFSTIADLAPFYERVRNPESSDLVLPYEPVGPYGEQRFRDARNAIGRVIAIGERE